MAQVNSRSFDSAALRMTVEGDVKVPLNRHSNHIPQASEHNLFYSFGRDAVVVLL